MKISVIQRTLDFRGDHAADVAIAHDLKEGETVQELVERLIVKPRSSYIEPETQWIELRVIKENI